MQDNLTKKVQEFYDRYNIGYGGRFEESERRSLRMNLLKEEYQEYVDAEEENDLVKIADALADMEYIIRGTALEYGIPLEEVFDEVHRSNMTKELDLRREDGKILKGETYEPPKIREILEGA